MIGTFVRVFLTPGASAAASSAFHTGAAPSIKIFKSSIDNIENFDYSNEAIEDFEKFVNEICKKANDIEKKDKLLEDENK